MQAAKPAVKEQGKDQVHILVVDDERSICELLEITFRKEGYRVEVAPSVDAAKRMLPVGVGEVVAEGGVAEAPRGEQRRIVQLGGVMDQNVLHAVS